MCTGVHVHTCIASLCVCQHTSQYAEGWNDLNVSVTLREQFKQSRHIECLNKHFCSLGRQMLTIYVYRIIYASIRSVRKWFVLCNL